MGERRKAAVDWIDRIGGRLFCRALGILVAIVLLVAAWGTWEAYKAVMGFGMALCGSAAIGLAFLLRYLFSRDRRLSEIEFH
jgi:hypothetical protein